MKPRDIVLTGQAECWPNDEANAAFLGPWCFTRSPRRFWDHEKFEILPSPWKSHTQVEEALRYVNHLCDRVMPPLVDALNHFHDENRTIGYWRPVLSAWLSSWLGVLFDRYETLGAVPWDAESYVVKVAPPGHGLRPSTMANHVEGLGAHAYNLALFSDLMRVAPTLRGHRTEIVPCHLKMPAAGAVAASGGMKRTVAEFLDRLTQKSLIQLEPGFGMSRWDILRVSLRLDPRLLFRSATDVRLTPPAEKLTFSEALGGFLPTNPFEEAVAALILSYVPASSLMRAEVRGGRKAVVVAPGSDYSPTQAYRIANVLESGGTWISTQHGGGYMQLQAMPLEKLEYVYPTRSFVWTRKPDYGAPNIEPLPSPHLSKLKPRILPAEKRILLIANLHLPYQYRLQTSLYPHDIPAYVRQYRTLLETVSEPVYRRIAFRPYFDDYGFEVAELLRSGTRPPLAFVEGRLRDHLRTCELAVIDYPGTVLLEALTMNVPTVLYWPSRFFGLSSDMESFMQRFREAGVFFSSAADAAAKLKATEGCIEAWWSSPDIQRVRDDFCRHYCYVDQSWRRRWRRRLKRELTSLRLSPATDGTAKTSAIIAP